MKTINLFNNKALHAFWAKALLFLLIFNFAIATFASPMIITAGDIENKTSESVPDSLSQDPNTLEPAKIYIAEGTTFYNTEELNGIVEIIQKEKSTIVTKKKISIQLSKKIVKPYTVKPNTQKEKYTAKLQFRQNPLESNSVFSRNGGKVITVPSSNPQPKIVALVVQYYIYFYLPIRDKHNSKYMMSFANEISHWQMRIRPPPAV